MTPSTGDPCPKCGEKLEGLARKCWAGGDGCGWTAADEPAEAPTTIPDDRTEAEIEWDVAKALTAMGWQVYKTSQPHRATGMDPGISDLIVFGYGLTAWIEVKTATGRQSDDQRTFERVVTENGGIYRIVRSASEAVEWAREARERVA